MRAAIALVLPLWLAACSTPADETRAPTRHVQGAPSGEGNGATASSGSSGGGSGSSSGGTSAPPPGDSGAGGAADAGGATSGPGPSQPPAPDGFQKTIAPLLDASGCTECHHAGRPIDLTRYPFMAGAAKDAADALVAQLPQGMPPAPRPAADASVIAAVKAWQAAGMKP